ncbi:hypothetical protein GCM10008024_37360 [Allgaiera indica]|uniref:Uncharacterized protein n=1 Tax=Allgaiera indica TaxID=765699 RepID=A0AAN4UUK2_9RHOB|nr:hypothetical protein [Allgaiera indica]GHE05674.1 hypothetical protein GCM10008024_37360 [Allgaiera indica]SDX76101.1 hypothetical protein SAMN05444006_1288 [Allgaiera indica]
MTPRYIARSWHVPPQTVVQALGLAPGRGHPEPLDVLARKAGIPLTRAIAQVRAAIARERAAKGDPARDRASRP